MLNDVNELDAYVQEPQRLTSYNGKQLSAPTVPHKLIFIQNTSFRGPKTDNSGDASRIVPRNRWDADVGWFEYTTLNRRFGSFVEDPDLFDAAFFKISEPEATALDAQQRLALEGAWETTSNFYASVDRSRDNVESVSVAVGVSYNEYYLNTASQGMSAFTATSGTLSVICGRISYIFGFKGPSLSIDTACSSSLVAIHLVSSSFIPSGYAKALVVGVNLTIRAETTAVLAKAGVLTVDGRCKTMDASADGYARGESCIVHLLESVETNLHSENDGVVLSGTAVNQDGRSSSLTAPNGPSQQIVIREALGATASNLHPHQICTLELHGTGTSLGDPLEVGAALAIFDSEDGNKYPLQMQAAKSNLLHTEPAAGALGIFSLLKRMKGDTPAKMLHLRNLNTHVSSLFDNSRQRSRGCHFNRELAPFVDLSQNVSSGSVSSFAYQGTNAHAVLQTKSSAPQNFLRNLSGNAVWEKSSYWFQQTCHPFLGSCTHAKQVLIVECNLNTPSVCQSFDIKFQDRFISHSHVLEIAMSVLDLCVKNEKEKECLVMNKVSFPALNVFHWKQAPMVLSLDLVLGDTSIFGPKEFKRNSYFQGICYKSYHKASRTMDDLSFRSLDMPKHYERANSAFFNQSQHRCEMLKYSIAFSSILEMKLKGGYLISPAWLEATFQIALFSLILDSVPMLPSAMHSFSQILSPISSSSDIPNIRCESLKSWFAQLADRTFSASGIEFKPIDYLKSESNYSSDKSLKHIVGLAQAKINPGEKRWIASNLRRVVEEFVGKEINPEEILLKLGISPSDAERFKRILNENFMFNIPDSLEICDYTIDELSTILSNSDQMPITAMAVVGTLQDLISDLVDSHILPDQPLMEAGLDSIGFIEFRNAIQDNFRINVPSTVAFDYPTLISLANFITESLEHPNEVKLSDSLTSVDDYAFHDHSISYVVGISNTCNARYTERSSDSYQRYFYGTQDLVGTVPFERWDSENFGIIDPDIYNSVKFSVWMGDIANFDVDLFRISYSEGIGIDPQCRILLEQAWCSLSMTNITNSPSSISETAVFVGCVWTEYHVYQQSLNQNLNAASLTGSGLNFTSGRVSYTLGLQGPCIGLDTACSSSLVAVHLGNKSLRNKETSVALAAGTNLILLPSTSASLARLGSLSNTGRSKTLDASADGYGRGESCISLVLQSHTSDNLSDCLVNRPYAVVHGSAYNQDGRSSGLTAPNGPAQTSLIKSASLDAKCSLQDVALVSMHGTGTSLGDPIEINALVQAFSFKNTHRVNLCKDHICLALSKYKSVHFKCVFTNLILSSYIIFDAQRL